MWTRVSDMNKDGVRMRQRGKARADNFMSRHRTLRAFLKRPTAVLGLLFLVFLLVLTLFPDFVAPYDSLVQNYDELRAPPSIRHLMGTDEFGRDVLSRVIHGTKYALIVGGSTTLIQVAIGVVLGLAAGYYGGIIDSLIMRFTDVMLSVPVMVLALAIAGFLGGGLFSVIIAIGVVGWRAFARVVRGQVLSIREAPYVEAARALGCSDVHILWRHILPNVSAPLLVLVTLNIPQSILWASAMNYLGLGIQPPTPDWGAMLSNTRAYLRTAWWMAMFPGLAIMFTVLTFNFVGDGLNDALNPKTRV